MLFRLVRWVTNRDRGLKEDNLLRLIKAFVLCHFTYTMAMHNWLRDKRDKLNVLICKNIQESPWPACQDAYRGPPRLGMRNTMAEAQPPADNLACNFQLRREIREKLAVAPLPRNVHSVHNAGSRNAKASAILKHIYKVEAIFVDAAISRDAKALAVSVCR
ncbi:hypothetical protein HPB50_029281 [Hyalomma asiaticum]|nr:hypothetical protein HPB50_029281 [Hyalomma asiaticum]